MGAIGKHPSPLIIQALVACEYAFRCTLVFSFEIGSGGTWEQVWGVIQFSAISNFSITSLFCKNCLSALHYYLFYLNCTILNENRV